MTESEDEKKKYSLITGECNRMQKDALSFKIIAVQDMDRMVPVTKQARPSRVNFAVDAIAKRNMEKAVVYRCQHANWRTRQQKSMTSGDTR